MFKEAFEQLKKELFNGVNKKGHPFRYFTLATLNNGRPKQRTVVLRKISKDLKFTFYTDCRSPKIEQIKSNENVNLLFYHPKKLIQITIEGKAKQITNNEVTNTYWHALKTELKLCRILNTILKN